MNACGSSYWMTEPLRHQVHPQCRKGTMKGSSMWHLEFCPDRNPLSIRIRSRTRCHDIVIRCLIEGASNELDDEVLNERVQTLSALQWLHCTEKTSLFCLAIVKRRFLNLSKGRRIQTSSSAANTASCFNVDKRCWRKRSMEISTFYKSPKYGCRVELRPKTRATLLFCIC